MSNKLALLQKKTSAVFQKMDALHSETDDVQHSIDDLHERMVPKQSDGAAKPYPIVAVVKKGIGRIGGQVGLESRAGCGTKFWIELPKTSFSS